MTPEQINRMETVLRELVVACVQRDEARGIPRRYERAVTGAQDFFEELKR